MAAFDDLAIAAADLVRVEAGELTAAAWVQVHGRRILAASAGSSSEVSGDMKRASATIRALSDGNRAVRKAVDAFNATSCRRPGKPFGYTPLRWAAAVACISAVEAAMAEVAFRFGQIFPQQDAKSLLAQVVDLVKRSGADPATVERVQAQATESAAKIEAATAAAQNEDPLDEVGANAVTAGDEPKEPDRVH